MASDKESKYNFLLTVIRDILTIVVVPILGWMLYSAVQVQKEIVTLQLQVAQVAKDVIHHSDESKEISIKNSMIHHRTDIEPCNRCHKTK